MSTEPRILIVEDLPTDAELTERELRKAGIAYTARRVETKEAFLKELTDFEPDIILSDYSLPQFNGLEALRLLKEMDVDVPFILITGSLTEEVAVDCMKEGATDYILKASLKRLSSAVLSALEKKKTEREKEEAVADLRRSEARYRQLVELSPEMIAVHCEGKFVYVNNAGMKLLGAANPEDLIGLPIIEIIHPDYREMVLSRMEQNHQGRQSPLAEQKLIRLDGQTIDVEVTGIPTTYQDKPAVQIIIQDITERKAAEEALRQSEEQLRQSQKLEAVGQLAGGIAHDFNNLLTVINGNGDLLLRGMSDEKQRERVQEIKKAGERATQLTRQLLAFSRKQVLQPVVLNLNTIVPDIDRMLRRLIGADIDFHTVFDPELRQVKADPGQIEQVLMNLVINARDAMPKGGKLTIQTANVYLDESYVRHHAVVQPGSYVMLAVSDTGTGMDAETQARIFEPFFTTKEKGKGTGLGLSTVYGIVKQSGGNIWVYSEVGHGTTFKIYLPCVTEAAAPHTQAAPLAATPQGSETVLLVEDEEIVRKLARDILELNGYRVLAAADGGEALSLCERHEGPIHLMLTDVVMPQMSGREVAERAVALRPTMKVLYMSGYTDDSIIHHGVLDAGVAFLEKPFTPDAMACKVRQVLDTLQGTARRDGAHAENTGALVPDAMDLRPDTENLPRLKAAERYVPD